MGFVNGDDFQIVYSDTPGILKPNYKLQESMLKFVNTAFIDADIILYVTDVVETFDKNETYIARLQKTKIPIIILINKIDLSNEEQLGSLVDEWHLTLPKAEILPVSAIKKVNLQLLFDKILSLLPEGPEYYPKDTLTDKSERFFISEIIREKIFLNYHKEIPYSTEVEIESFVDEPKIVRIRAVIYVMRTSQKGIVIGHQGKSLKKVGTEARKDIEGFLDKKVFLEIYVKVNEEWRDNTSRLKSFGYEN
jgi:GTP-binding protein Era